MCVKNVVDSVCGPLYCSSASPIVILALNSVSVLLGILGVSIRLKSFLHFLEYFWIVLLVYLELSEVAEYRGNLIIVLIRYD